MVAKRPGVILTVTAGPSRAGIPLLGGFGPAQAAVEALTRGLSAEFAPHGNRIVGLRPDGMPEMGTIKEVFGIHANTLGLSWEQFHEIIASKNHAWRCRVRLVEICRAEQPVAFFRQALIEQDRSRQFARF